jgi:hypothetical protein
MEPASMKQGTFAPLACAGKEERTRRETFLAEMGRWCLGRG